MLILGGNHRALPLGIRNLYNWVFRIHQLRANGFIGANLMQP